MEKLSNDNSRKKIIDKDINNWFTLIEGSIHFPIISQVKPFLYSIGDTTGKSLHSILTTTLDFKSPHDLPDDYHELYYLTDEFLYRLYIHIQSQDWYRDSRVIQISENAHFPEFHKHFSLAHNKWDEKILLSDSVNANNRKKLDSDQIRSYRKTLAGFRDSFVKTQKGSELLEKITDYNSYLWRQV